MSTTSILYQDMISALNSFETFCTKYDLVKYNLFKAEESSFYSNLRKNPIIDSIIRFLKALKEYAVKAITAVYDFVSRILSYDAWITLRNLSKFKRIESAYRKADAATRNAIDEKLVKVRMSACWNYNNFKNIISQFGALCKFGVEELATTLDEDVEAIPSSQLSYVTLLSSMDYDSKLNARFNLRSNDFEMKNKLETESGQTFGELGIDSIDVIKQLINSYELELNYYKRLIKLPSVLRDIGFKLDNVIDDVNDDITVADNIKMEQDAIKKSIINGIKIAKKYVEFVRSIGNSINIKISAILNKTRIVLAEKDALYKKQEDRYSKESFMTETTIVVTTDNEFNKRYNDLVKIINTINEINSQQIYPELTVIQDNQSLKDFDGVHEFCKQQSTSTVIPLKLNIQQNIENLEEIKSNFITDINRCIADTEMVVSINTENYFVVSMSDSVPNMEYLLDKAEYYKLF